MSIRSLARARAEELGATKLLEHLAPAPEAPSGELPFPLEAIHPRWFEHIFAHEPQRLRAIQHVLPSRILSELPQATTVTPLPPEVARRFLRHLLASVTPSQEWERILASAKHEGALLEQILLRGAPGAGSTPLLSRARWLLAHFPARAASELLPALFLPPLNAGEIPSWEHLPMDPLVLVTLARYTPSVMAEKG